MIALLAIERLTARLYLTGFYCPTTYTALQRAMPLTATAHRLGETLMLRLRLGVKVESQRTVLGPGEVAYWPPADSLVIALSRLVVMPSPVNLLGFVFKGLGPLRSLEECREGRASLRLPEGEHVEGSPA